jgi:hypothetical protein
MQAGSAFKAFGPASGGSGRPHCPTELQAFPPQQGIAEPQRPGVEALTQVQTPLKHPKPGQQSTMPSQAAPWGRQIVGATQTPPALLPEQHGR